MPFVEELSKLPNSAILIFMVALFLSFGVVSIFIDGEGVWYNLGQGVFIAVVTGAMVLLARYLSRRKAAGRAQMEPLGSKATQSKRAKHIIPPLSNNLFMLRIGHRGARAYAPENTIASFRKAMEIGVDAVELDVRKTKDNQLVVIHDEDVKRTTNSEGLVCKLTLKEIKAFSAEGDEKIPTLEEALDFLDKKVKVLLELKEEGIEKQVLDIVCSRGLEKNVVIVSFLEDALKKVRELNGEIETGLIYAKHSNPLKAALELKANYLAGLYRFVHTGNVEKAHENGLKMVVWTINTPEEVEDYIKKGVDGITTDKPDIFSKIKLQVNA